MPSFCTSHPALPVIPPRDVAIGHPAGDVALLPARPARVEPDPARALRDALRPALRRSPCVVAFSGGRDSSLLLAVAADLAVRDGFEPPVAVTFRYPGDAAADESAWQDLVAAHLRERGLAFEWVRQDIGDELDLVGPLTAPVLRAHGGPTFPAALGNTILLARHAAGGSLVTGNAGDEVLGGHRAGVLRAVARRRARGLTRADWRLAATCAAPAPIRSALARRALGEARWLRPEPRRAALAAAARRHGRRPLRWDRSVWSALAPRAGVVGRRTRTAVVRGHDATLVEPLSDPAFVASYAAFGGRWGGLTRAAAMRLLADGLLPEEMLARRDKAEFNGSRFGPVARAFATEWAGQGVDEGLVDPVALRAAWLSDVPPAGTAMLLQQAWLATAKERS
ncbi:asparagine synthase-related protein [Prauserella muralis]|uniref:Asparagine synthetase domain-containing protein n=1 Tax=Prauserella muralis TaxID=588067 RepID=A0A2V4BAJ0_9PSEU|nr:asparagine synthase-related protein [Prauserella muralis]PXY32081.1 hypothetical protein BAY60_07200 [Prauserella muralis]TWE13462.1 asparagine synthase (glutamine-hydrolysing) [Prauserella muralis]